MKNQKHPSELFSFLIFLGLLLVALCFLKVLLTSRNQCLGLLHLDFTTLEITNEAMLGNWSWWNLMGEINKYHWNLEFTNKILERKTHNWYQKVWLTGHPRLLTKWFLALSGDSIPRRGKSLPSTTLILNWELKWKIPGGYERSSKMLNFETWHSLLFGDPNFMRKNNILTGPLWRFKWSLIAVYIFPATL